MVNFVPFALAAFFLSSGTAPQTGDLEAGRAVFRQRCAGCHGETGEGRDSTERTFAVELRHLGSAEVQAMTDSELRTLLTEGGKRAKPVRNMSAPDTNNVIRFLRSLQLKD